MKEVKGDIWDLYDKGNWIVIPTNCTVKKNGEAVMGRGLALQAKIRFPTTPYTIGKYLKELGNTPIRLNDTMLTFPVKYNWWEKADIKLIEESCSNLLRLMRNSTDKVYLPRVGCGNGKLDWKDVKPILEKYLDDRFIVVSRS